MPTYNFNLIIESIQNHRINIAWISVNTIQKLIKAQTGNCQTSSKNSITNLLGGLTKIISFGGKISSASCKDFFHRFTRVKSLRHCYLLAESPIPISLMVRNSHDYDSVGYLLPNTRVKVIQNNSQNQSTNLEILAEANKTGFICIEREPQLFAIGFLNPHRYIICNVD